MSAHYACRVYISTVNCGHAECRAAGETPAAPARLGPEPDETAEQFRHRFKEGPPPPEYLLVLDKDVANAFPWGFIVNPRNVFDLDIPKLDPVKAAFAVGAEVKIYRNTANDGTIYVWRKP